MTREDALKIFSVGFSRFLARKNLTLAKASEILGVSTTTIHFIKSGKNFPSVEGIFTLIDHGMKLEEIFGVERAKILYSGFNAPNEQAAHSDPCIFDSEEFRQGVLKVLSEEQILKFKMNQSSDKLIDNITK